MLTVRSKSTDVYRNLAMEEWLLDHAPQLPVLFLYVNDPCVVIGKNQNPWRECRLSLMEEEGVPLARRVSGGGAVYHDGGNLNLSILVPRTDYREDRQYELIFQTLEAFGIRASKVRKNTLAVDGKKFSGQAFCYRKDRVLHHGTLLVNADLARLGRYLGPELDGIETKAVASVPAEVANLSEFAPELTVESLSKALIETFKKEYGLRPGGACAPEGSRGVVECWSDPDVSKKNATQLLPMTRGELAESIGKLSSNDWKLCHTPKFAYKGVEVEKGRVVNVDGAPLFDEWRKEYAADI